MASTTPLVGATVTVKPVYLADPTQNTAEVVAMGHGDGVWLRFEDGAENWFPTYAIERRTEDTAGQEHQRCGHKLTAPAVAVLVPADADEMVAPF